MESKNRRNIGNGVYSYNRTTSVPSHTVPTYSQRISSDQFKNEAVSETDNELRILSEQMRQNPQLIQKTYYYQKTVKARNAQQNGFSLAMESFLTLLVLFVSISCTPPIERTIPYAVIMCDSHSGAIRVDVLVVTVVLLFMSWVFSMEYKRAQLLQQVSFLKQLFILLVGSMLNYLLYVLVALFIYGILPEGLCRLFFSLKSPIFLQTIFDGFYTLFYKFSSFISRDWVVVLSLASVVFLMGVIVRMFFNLRYIRIAGLVVHVVLELFWTSPGNPLFHIFSQGEAIILSYMLFNVVDCAAMMVQDLLESRE